MNAAEAIKTIEKGQQYKFVCQIIPPMLAVANMSTDMSHASIGTRYDLVEVDLSAVPPYKIKNPGNFKAGRLRVNPDGSIIQTGHSTDFSEPENAFETEQELQSFFAIADIQILG
ncbi:hypothetical protein HZC27_00675 [Candidatus Roizmanbacteria bacterium]|nr:hypothetical protein [Candidatus Roizmanbacteria bacterium]